jgi:Flp pilus assembly CpaF family ATPase
MRSHQQATREDLATEIADSVDYVIQIRRYPSGRKVSDIVEVTGFSRDRKMYECDSVYSLAAESSLLTTTLGGN